VLRVETAWLMVANPLPRSCRLQVIFTAHPFFYIRSAALSPADDIIKLLILYPS